MKEWTIEIYLLDQEGKEHPANCFTKVTYNLHPSFEQPTQSLCPYPWVFPSWSSLLTFPQRTPSRPSSAPMRVGASSR